MSKTTKRKHVTSELLNNYDVPTGLQKIVKVLNGRGNNLHEVEDANGQKYLVSMPTKFRRNVWMKRGCFVVVEPIEEGNKVKAEIIHILLKDQIKNLKTEGKWPVEFDSDIKSDEENHDASDGNADGSSPDEDDDLVPNPNRRQDVPSLDEESSSESDDSSDEDEGDTGSDGDDEKSSQDEGNHDSSKTATLIELK